MGSAADNKIRDSVAEQARGTVLGTVALVERPGAKTGDVVLRYNFPAAGLTDDALRTLILMVLAGGADARAAIERAELSGGRPRRCRRSRWCG